MEILELSQIRAHNLSMRHNRTPMHKKSDIRHSLESKYLEQFAQDITEIRSGSRIDSEGKVTKRPSRDIYLHQACEKYFGTDIKGLLRLMDLDSDGCSLSDVYQRFGGSSDLTGHKAHQLLLSRNEFSFGSASFDASTRGTASSPQIPSDYRFIVPELISAAIRIGYEGAAKHLLWVAMTENMSKRKLTMPQIQRGDGVATRINEGSSIPVGSINYSKKDVTVFKVGTGFSITDELVFESSIDMMMQFIQQVGIDMAICSDVEALRVLISGEQADLSESAPVVGVDTANTRAFNDLKNVFWQMDRLANPANRIITNMTEGKAITSIDRLEGFNGDTKLATARTIVGVPEQFDIDIHSIIPANQAMFLSPGRCMAKLAYRGMQMEEQRDPSTQKTRMYVTDHSGFAIIRRDGRVIQDRSVAFSSYPFPDYMDIDARIQEQFNTY